MVISSCSLAEARNLLDHFLKASIDKVSDHTAGLETFVESIVFKLLKSVGVKENM